MDGEKHSFQPWLNVSNSCNWPCAFVPQNPSCKNKTADGVADDAADLQGEVAAGAARLAALGLVAPSESLKAIDPTGVWTNPGYGVLTIIRSSDGVVTLTFNAVVATVTPYTSPTVFVASCTGEYAVLLGVFGLVFSPDGSTLTIPAMEPLMPPVFARSA